MAAMRTQTSRPWSTISAENVALFLPFPCTKTQFRSTNRRQLARHSKPDFFGSKSSSGTSEHGSADLDKSLISGLLTGGLLVRVQPEEPNRSNSTTSTDARRQRPSRFNSFVRRNTPLKTRAKTRTKVDFDSRFRDVAVFLPSRCNRSRPLALRGMTAVAHNCSRALGGSARRWHRRRRRIDGNGQRRRHCHRSTEAN